MWSKIRFFKIGWSVLAITVLLFASGCTTLMVPVPVTCPIPDQYLVSCEATDKAVMDQSDLTLEAVRNRLLSNGDTPTPNDYVEAIGAKDDQLFEAKKKLALCTSRHRLVAEMIQACNRNSDAVRPRILSLGR